MRFNQKAGSSQGKFLPCLSTSSWVANNSTNTADAASIAASNSSSTSASILRTLPNRQDQPDANPTPVRMSWLLPVNEAVKRSTVYTLVLPKACTVGGLKAGVAELQMFKRVDLSMFGSTAGLIDDHFHRKLSSWHVPLPAFRHLGHGVVIYVRSSTTCLARPKPDCVLPGNAAR